MKEMMLGLVYMIMALFITMLLIGTINTGFDILFNSPAVIPLIFIVIMMLGGLLTFIKGYKQNNKQ